MMNLNIIQVTFLLLFLFILTTSCKNLDFDPSTSVLKYMLTKEQKEQIVYGTETEE